MIECQYPKTVNGLTEGKPGNDKAFNQAYIMKTKMISISSAMALLLVTGMTLLTACSANNSSPEYLLEGARDNGFVASYRAYFAIENGNIFKITKAKYENYIYREDNKHYKLVPKEQYCFKAHAEDSDSLKLEYEQKYPENPVYEIDMLTKQLSMMDISYSGNSDIQIIKFDDYYLIEVENLDGNTVIASAYAIFHNGEKLSMEEGIDLSSIRNIYKYYE